MKESVERIRRERTSPLIMRLVDRVKGKNSVQEEAIDGESGVGTAETVEGNEAGKGEKPEVNGIKRRRGLKR